MARKNRESISIFRAVNRKKIKEQVKEENIGISKKNRMRISDVWNYFQDRRYGKGVHTAILINNAPNKPGARKKVFEERR